MALNKRRPYFGPVECTLLPPEKGEMRASSPDFSCCMALCSHSSSAQASHTEVGDHVSSTLHGRLFVHVLAKAGLVNVSGQVPPHSPPKQALPRCIAQQAVGEKQLLSATSRFPSAALAKFAVCSRPV